MGIKNCINKPKDTNAKTHFSDQKNNTIENNLPQNPPTINSVSNVEIKNDNIINSAQNIAAQNENIINSAQNIAAQNENIINSVQNVPTQNENIINPVQKEPEKKKKEKTPPKKKKKKEEDDDIPRSSTMEVDDPKKDVDNFIKDEYTTTIKLYFTLKNVKERTSYTIELDQFLNNRKTTLRTMSKTESVERDSLCNMVKFPDPLILQFHFSQVQPLVFKLFSSEDRSTVNVEVTFGEIIGSNRLIYRKTLPSGLLFEIEAELADEIQKELSFNVEVEGALTGMKINYNILGLGTQFNPMNKNVYESEKLENNALVKFNKINIPLNELTEDEDIESSLIEINFNDVNHSVNLGKFNGTIANLLSEKKILELGGTKKAKINCLRNNFYSLFDYLKRDFQIYTILAIDFSEKSSAMHNVDESGSTLFEKMLNNSLDILKPYADDEFYQIFGTGFKFKSERNMSEYNNDVYPLSLNVDKITIEISKIRKLYKTFLNEITPGENLNLSVILNKRNQKIKEEMEGYENEVNEYNVLIYFVGSDLNDKEEFIEQLVQCSFLNLSVIVIGLNKCDYKELNWIDQNFMELSSKDGKKPDRKCFKFVNFRDCGKNYQKTVQKSFIDIPAEILEYLNIHRIEPKM